MSKELKVLFLTNNENTKELSDWLALRCEFILMQEKVDLETVQNIAPDLVVSFNYRYIIKQDVIDYMNDRILNLHMSYLPWNRGSSPNFWSHVDGSKKGVTIHLINAGLDKGDILFQKEVEFDLEKETFMSTYDRLMKEMMALFVKNWDVIQAGTYERIPQTETGSYHCMKDLEEVEKKCPFAWSDNIGEYLQRYKECMEDK